MTIEAIRKLFFTGAIFNWLVGLALLFDAPMLFRLFHVSPAPTEPLFVQLFAWLVIIFGVGYFWISRDPPGHAPIIELGILGKISVFLVCLAGTVTHMVSWQMMILATTDLIYAVLFFWALRTLRTIA